jgi:hypothetical protein
MLELIRNPWVRGIGSAAGIAITLAVVTHFIARREKGSKLVSEPISEADAQQRRELEGSIKHLINLMTKQREKRPMFLTSEHSLRVRYLSNKVTYNYVDIPTLSAMLTEIKEIYDGAEKRT